MVRRFQRDLNEQTPLLPKESEQTPSFTGESEQTPSLPKQSEQTPSFTGESETEAADIPLETCNELKTFNQPETTAKVTTISSTMISAKNRNIFFLTVLTAANIIVKRMMVIYNYNYPSFVAITNSLRNCIVIFSFLLLLVCFSKVMLKDNQEKKFTVRNLIGESFPYKTFFILGFLEALISTSTYFAYTYLPNRLIVLLQVGLIPLTGFINFSVLNKMEKIGCSFVALGIAAILLSILDLRDKVTNDTCYPIDEDFKDTCKTCLDIGDDEEECLDNYSETCEFGDFENDSNATSTMFLWGAILAATAIPQYLAVRTKSCADSGVHKMKPVTRFGLTSLFSVGFTVGLSVLFAWIGNPTVEPSDWSENFNDGSDCYRGTNTIETGCNVDDCDSSSLWINVYTVVNILYQSMVFYVTDQPDAEDIMLVSVSLMVPICQIFFLLPFMPTVTGGPEWSNIVALLLVIIGLSVYRKGALADDEDEVKADDEEDEDFDSMRKKMMKSMKDVFAM